MGKKLNYLGNPDECFICKSTYCLQTHHIMNGANKKSSEKYGLLVKVCPNCHTLAPNSIHRDSNLLRKLKQIGQEHFEESDTREEFMRIFGRNYLDLEVS